MYPARVDDKGRLKVPKSFEQYFGALPEKKLFVTSLDRRIGRIYPISAWMKTADFILNFGAEPETAERVWFVAQDLGADSEMDGQGRILLPPELRRELMIEDQPVRLCAAYEHVEILSEAIYQERRQQSLPNQLTSDVHVLKRAGMR